MHLYIHVPLERRGWEEELHMLHQKPTTFARWVAGQGPATKRARPPNPALSGCWQGKHLVFVPLWLIHFGLTTSGATDAAGGQELELQGHWVLCMDAAKLLRFFQGRNNFLAEQEGPPWSRETADQHFILLSSILPMTACHLHWICFLLPDIQKG